MIASDENPDTPLPQSRLSARIIVSANIGVGMLRYGCGDP
jgi:hypothetical protein